MRTSNALCLFVVLAAAERPFLNEPDTGLEIEGLEKGTLPPLELMMAAPDFEAAARHVMDERNYSYYRTGSAGEFEYRRSLEIFDQVKLRPRLLRDMSNVSMETTILGYKFSLPIFIAPAARAGLAHPDGELNLVRAAGESSILYAPSISASQRLESIASVAQTGQTMFHQLYVSPNKTKLASDLRRIEASGYKALLVTVDNPIHGIRTREERFGWSNTTDHDVSFSWGSFKELQGMTKLPVVPKGIQTVEDALLAVEAGAPAIYVSNHGARQLDGSQLPLETLLEIRKHAPEVFDKTTVLADGGVRYGSDAVKLLALGVKAVGLGRPFMYANVYGEEGVARLIDILRRELWITMANVGVTKLDELGPRYVNAKRLERFILD